MPRAYILFLNMAFVCTRAIVISVLVATVGLVSVFATGAARSGDRQEQAPQEALAEVIDPIRIFVFAGEEATDDTIDVSLPAAERAVGGLRTYRFDAGHGRDAVRTIRRRLGKGARRQELIRIVDTPEQANVFVEVVATEAVHFFTADGSANRDPVWPAPGLSGTLGSRVGHAQVERLVVANLTVRNDEFSTSILGRRLDILRPPDHEIAAKVEHWVEVNYPSLLRIIYGLQ